MTVQTYSQPLHRLDGFLADALDGVMGRDPSQEHRRRDAFAAAHGLAGAIGVALWPIHWAVWGPVDMATGIGFFWLWAPIGLALYVLIGGDLRKAEAGSAFCLTGLVTYGAIFSGGLMSPLLPWLLVAPIEAAVPGRRAAVLIAGLLSCLGLGVLILMTMTGAMPLSRLGPDLATSVAGVTMATALAAATLAARAIQRRNALSEARTQEGAALYQMIAEHASDMISRHNANGMVMYASPASVSLLGLAPYELQGLSPAMFVHIQDLTIVENAFARAAEGMPQSVQFRLRHKDGSYVYVEMRAQAAEGDIVAVTRDITAMKNAEAALTEARDAAEEASKAKSRFLANMSHELRTPLNAIIGFSDIMKQEILGPIGSERYREYAGLIRDSGQHLVDLITDLLDMSKIEAGKFSLDTKTFELAPLVEECISMVRVTAEDAGVLVRRDVANGLPMLTADRRALKQSLINLLSNAIKFTPAEGRVTVAASLDGEAMLIQVRDTGVGIPAKDMARIGKPFEQAEGEMARLHKGTGLGLSLVKALAELHGGSMTIESALGDGTTVSLRLPLKPQQRVATDDANLVYPERFRAAGASR